MKSFIHKELRYSLSKLIAFWRNWSNFNTKTFLRLTSVEISEFSLACGKRLFISYLCAKFCCDITLIACNTCIFHEYFWYFSTNRQRFQHNDVINYDVTVTIRMWVLSLLDFVHHYLCTKFCCSKLTTNGKKQGDLIHPPPHPLPSSTRDFRSPVEIVLKGLLGGVYRESSDFLPRNH